MTLSARRLSTAALVLGEALGFLSLFLAPEVEPKFLLVVAGFGLLGFFLKVRVANPLLLLLVGGAVLAGLGLAAFSALAIALTISRSILLVHALLWQAKDAETYRYWRLGLAFFEIILAAILSPETHMFLIIFGFVVASALALSFGFLERNFRARQAPPPPIPSHFAGAVLVLTLVIFLSSLLIFPLLPRSNWSGAGRQWTETGYSEEVSFRGSAMAWANGASRPLVWIFLPDGARWPEVMPYGLLRGKVLDSFNGLDWRSGVKQVDAAEANEEGLKVEFFREPMNADVLPVPYGTQNIYLASRARPKFTNGEWPAFTHRDKRVQYEVYVGAHGIFDAPKKAHSELPDPKMFPTVYSLARNLNRGSDGEKAGRVLKYFAAFTARLAPTFSALDKGPHPIERFLRDSKEGHCELFATAAALIFRAMGVPARLVVGFRGSYPTGNVLTVKNTDAHAWVEIWTAARGWVPVDPTPAIAAPKDWFEPLGDAYEYVNAYWHRYILGYEFDGRLFFRQSGGALPWLGSLLVLLLLWRARKLWRRRPRQPRYQVTKIWARIEKLRPNAKLREEYWRLRFGAQEPGSAELRDFSLHAKEFQDAAK